MSDMENTQSEDIKEEVSDNEDKENISEEETAQASDKCNKEEKTEKKEKKFGKKSKKEDELAKKVDDLTDQIRRNMAEFDNYRKRTDKEKAARFDMGQRSVVEKLLPVVDNFERGLSGLGEEELKEPFADGMAKTYKQLLTTLEELGVKSIAAVGEQFNPDYHNAVMHVDDEEAGENVIVEEFQKGYTMGDAVIRYSMVKVAN